MKETSERVSQVIMNGVFSSGKEETRRYRLDFYRGRLAVARIEASYYEEMIRLEEGKDSERRSREVDGSYEELLAEVQEWRLRERNSRGLSVKKEDSDADSGSIVYG